MTVLLLENYPHDGQQSMRRFGDLLAAELPKRGVTVRRLRPEPRFGSLRPGGSGVGKWLGYLDKFALFPMTLRREIARLRRGEEPFLVHVCDHSNALYTRHLQQTPHLVTCHDLLAIRSALGEFPHHPTGFTGRILQGMIRRGLRTSAHAACVSQATAAHLARLVPELREKSTVVYNGLNFPFRPLGRAVALERLRKSAHPDLPALWTGDSSRFLLHTGGNQWYKNRHGVVAAYATWRAHSQMTGVKLILAGKPPSAPLRAMLAAHPECRDDIIFLPDVSGEDLEALYSAAELFLFPSLEEGFGWPIIEAQACGCPVLTTAREPMTEIGGEAARYAAPDDPLDFPRQLAHMMHLPPGERAEIAQAGLANAGRFSTDRMIGEYVDLYRRLLQR